MLRRWKGFSFVLLVISSPISVAVYLKDAESPIFDTFMKNTPLPHRLRIVQYRVLPPSRSQHHCIVYYDETSSSDPDLSNLFHTVDQWGNHHSFIRRCENYKEPIYPINRLRNLAIQNILTTHFLVLDMDMWPISRSFLSTVIHRYYLSRSHYTSSFYPPEWASRSDSSGLFSKIVYDRELLKLSGLCREGYAAVASDQATTCYMHREWWVYNVPTRDTDSCRSDTSLLCRIIWLMDGTIFLHPFVSCLKVVSIMFSKSLILSWGDQLISHFLMNGLLTMVIIKCNG